MRAGIVPRSTRILAYHVGQGLVRTSLLHRRFLFSLFISFSFVEALFETLRNPSVFPWIWLQAPASLLVFVILFVCLSLLIRKIRRHVAKICSVLLAIALSVTANIFVLMFLVYPEDYWSKFLERVTGDASVAVVYIVAASVISSAYANHRETVEELNRVSKRLADQKNSQIKVAMEVEADLQQKASGVLGEELDRISQASKTASDEVESMALKMQIQSLVRNQVKPLSRELNLRVDVLASLETPKLQVRSAKNFWSLRTIPKLDASYIASWIMAMPNIFFTFTGRVGLFDSFFILIISLTYPFIGRALQTFLPGKRMAMGSGLALSALVSIAAYLPTGIFVFWLGLEKPVVDFTTYSAAGVLIFTCTTSTAWFALQRTREENAAEILKINSEIRHQLNLLEQSIWVAQRKWSYIIHGTVQGALTVAASRLEMAGKLDDSTRAAVQGDLERAKKALVSPPSFDKPVIELLNEIADTWRGVCEFEFVLSPSAEISLAASKSSVTCLVEISKELVSNAHRHGGASKIWINAYLDSEGDLAIVSGNNGREMKLNGPSGLGFEMISKLTKDHNWGFSGRNTFTATLPMPRLST